MTDTDLTERLAKHKTLGSAPREELAWLAAHGSLRQLRAGEVLSAKGTSVERLYGRAAGARIPGVDLNSAAKSDQAFFIRREIHTRITAPMKATIIEPMIPAPGKIPSIPNSQPPNMPPR